MKLKKKLAAIAVVGALGASTTAFAGIQTPVVVYDGTGNIIASTGSSQVGAFDWSSSGSGLAVGTAAGPLVVGQTFDFLYQANLAGFTAVGGGAVANADILSGLNSAFADGGYEFTVASRIGEVVLPSSTLPTNANFGVTGGSISIFYDSTTAGGLKSVVGTGVGFDDGIEIARFTITGGASNFNLTSTGGLGGTAYDFALTGAFDFVNTDYLVGTLGNIFDLHFTSSQVLPVDDSSTTAFHSGGSGLYATTAVTANDLLLKVDGSNTFTVPEPGTLALLGLAFAGLGFSRKKIS